MHIIQIKTDTAYYYPKSSEEENVVSETIFLESENMLAITNCIINKMRDGTFVVKYHDLDRWKDLGFEEEDMKFNPPNVTVVLYPNGIKHIAYDNYEPNAQ